MTPASWNSGWRKAAKYCGILLIFVVLLLGGLSWYATTDAFQAMVKRRLIAQAERITGGKVEVGSIHAVPFRFRVEVRDLIIHGREGAGEAPLASIDSLSAEIKIISILESDYGFRSLVLEHPVFHIIVYPDGSTNQPTTGGATEAREYVDQLFSVNINRLDLRRGELRLNDRKIPLDCSVNDVSADLTYSIFHLRYEGNLLLGKIVTTVQNYRPVAWMMEAHFQITPQAVTIRSLSAHSARSRVEASGRIDNFPDPRVEAKYNVDLNVAEAGAVTRHPEARGGTLMASGTGSWSAKDFSSGGKIALRDLDWRSPSLTLTKVSLVSPFTITPRRIALSKIDARLLGGGVTGDGDVSNWLFNSSSPRSKTTTKLEQEGLVRLQLKDISTKELLAAVLPDSRDRAHINLEGIGEGSINLRWTGSVRRAQTQVDVAVRPPRKLASGQLPLTATARGMYSAKDGILQIGELSVATPASQIHASGEIGSSNLVKFSASTADLGEWTSLFRLLHVDQPMPVHLDGRAAFAGTASGRLSSPAVSGSLSAEDFDYTIPATDRNPEQTLHWDSLVADVQFSEHSFSAHHGKLEHGDSALDFDLSAQLHQGEFLPTSLFSARIAMTNADVHEVLALAGRDYPAQGKANLTVQASGTRGEPHASGRIEVADALVYGESVHVFRSRFQYQGHALSLSEILLKHEDATVTGDASYAFDRHEVQANIEGQNFELSTIRQIQSARFPIGGAADFKVRVSGSGEQPSVNGNISLHTVTIDGIPAGGFLLNARTDGGELHLDGHSQFHTTTLSIGGIVDLRADWPAKIDAHFEEFDIEPLLAKFGRGQVSGNSEMAGDIHLTGPLRRPSELHVEANVPTFVANVDKVKVQNDGPLRFSIEREVLHVEEFRLIGDGTDISVKGSLE